MSLSEKQKLIYSLYNTEILHGRIYQIFSKRRSSQKMKAIMSRLVKLEDYHAGLWAQVLRMNRMQPERSNHGFKLATISFLSRIFGTAVTVKIIEHMEGNLHQKLDKLIKEKPLSKAEQAIVDKVKRSEEGEEEGLEAQIVGNNPVFNNIRDVMFGMNDGLVEILAVVAGLAAALQTPILIFIAGFIVAVSGTLSMSAGAYLSTGYQKDIDLKAKKGSGIPTAKSSAFYVGVFYFIGSLFPLSPFAFGSIGYTGIIIAIILTSIVLTLTSSLIALASDRSIAKSVAKTLLLSLGAAAATILLGAYVRATFHITV
jgi:VIT1/CCC1 family predicted Fe2+/Mn2+ transporter